MWAILQWSHLLCHHKHFSNGISKFINSFIYLTKMDSSYQKNEEIKEENTLLTDEDLRECKFILCVLFYLETSSFLVRGFYFYSYFCVIRILVLCFPAWSVSFQTVCYFFSPLRHLSFTMLPESSNIYMYFQVSLCFAVVYRHVSGRCCSYLP